MPFSPESTKVPVSIGNIVVILKDAVETDDEEAYQSAHFNLTIKMSDGTTVTRKGDLVPKITPAQRAAQMAFMDSLRTQAESQILPT